MNRKALLLVVGVFVLGILVGGFGTFLTERRVFGGPGQRGGRASVVQQLTTDLQLSAEQQKQLQTILDDTRSRYEKVYESIQPDMQRIREEGRDHIRAILSADQRTKFDEFVRRLDEERKRRMDEERSKRKMGR